MSYHIKRAAVEIERADIDPTAIELRAIQRQQRRFAWITYTMIGVSFVHMFSALALFSRANLIEQIAAAGMTLMVDLATWGLAEYHHYAKRRKLARSAWVRVVFGVALFISCTLNGAYLYAHRPNEQALPWWMSVVIAALFALFVPMLIGTASLIRGELEDDRIQVQQRDVQSVLSVQKPRRASEKPNEHRTPLLLNDDATAIPASDLSYNAKAEISTADAGAIVAHLLNNNTPMFSSARELGRLCGWSSPASGSAGLKTLLNTGSVQRDEQGVYTVVYTEQEG